MRHQNPPPHSPENTDSSPASEPELTARPKFTSSDYLVIAAAVLLGMVALGFIPVAAAFPAALVIVVLEARKWWFPKRKVEVDR